MTLQLQRRFSNNITTLCRRLLIDVFFATLLQRRDMVERRRDLKITTLQRRHDVVCLLRETSQKHLKRDDFFVTSLRRLKYISKKISFL